MHADIKERIENKIQRLPFSGCWIFMGSLNHGGYGQIGVGGKKKMMLAHRASYLAYRGDVPQGLELDHLCRVRSCCNPDHLEAVTSQENSRRGIQVDPPLAVINRKKTHCQRGHEYSAENTYFYTAGKYKSRICRICNLAAANKRYQDSRRVI